MDVRHFKNEKTGQVQRAVEGSRLHLLMGESAYFTEVEDPAGETNDGDVQTGETGTEVDGEASADGGTEADAPAAEADAAEADESDETDAEAGGGAEGGGDGAGGGSRRRGPARKAADGRRAKQG